MFSVGVESTECLDSWRSSAALQPNSYDGFMRKNNGSYDDGLKRSEKDYFTTAHYAGINWTITEANNGNAAWVECDQQMIDSHFLCCVSVRRALCVLVRRALGEVVLLRGRALVVLDLLTVTRFPGGSPLTRQNPLDEGLGCTSCSV